MGYSNTYGFIISQEKMSENIFNNIYKIAVKYISVENARIKHIKRKGIPNLNEPELVEFRYGKISFNLPKSIEGKVIIDPLGKMGFEERYQFKIGEISISHPSFFFHNNDGEDIPLIMEKTLPVYKELYYLLNPIIGCWWAEEIPSSMAEKIESCYKARDASIAASILDKINVFPPWIVESLGKERVRSIPHFVVEELDDGGFFIHYPFDDFWKFSYEEELEEVKRYLKES